MATLDKDGFFAYIIDVGWIHRYSLPMDYLSVPSLFYAGSSSGRTAGFEPVKGGSIPSPATNKEDNA